MTELETALAYLHHLMAQPVREAEREAAGRLLVDSLGCALGGLHDEVTLRTLRAMSPQPDGVGILGHGTRLRPADALLVHGAAIRCMDFNDVFSRRNNHHPSEFVVPIVLALAERENWTGARTIEATARGYRIFLAMGEMWEGLLGRGWAPASTLGRSTAAALVGLLQGHPDDVVINAMAIATITAPTLGVVFKGELSHTKSLVNGMAARAGWEAAELAAAGITGPRDAFEGTAGFDQMSGGAFIPPDPEADMLTAADVSLKAYPTVFMTHTAIASAVKLSGEIRGPLRRVRVHAPEKVVTMAAAETRWRISTREAAQFSLPLSVATALVNGACGIADLSPERLNAPAVRAVLSVMEIAVEPRWTGYEGGRVEVDLKDGRTLSSETLAAPGHPANPMTDAQVLEKFVALASESFGAERALRIAKAVEGLASARDIQGIMEATRG